jgi:RimJ/RimL family protein N-acetyltransferase
MGAIGAPTPGWLEWTVAGYTQLETLTTPPYGERAVALRDGPMVGLVGLVPSLAPFGRLPGFGGDPATRERFRPEVGLYWALNPRARGNGYATEAARALIEWAFANLELVRIVATTRHDNPASQAVMRRLGMRLEQNPDPEPPWFQVVGWLDAPARSGYEPC